MKYLYVFEDGSLKQTSTAPTKDCLLSVANGILEIITYENDQFQCIDENNERYNIEETK